MQGPALKDELSREMAASSRVDGSAAAAEHGVYVRQALGLATENSGEGLSTEYAGLDVSVATEHEDIELSGVFDVTVQFIVIGPCKLHWSELTDLQLGTLRLLQQNIQDRFRVPVTLAQLHSQYESKQNSSANKPNKSYSGILETISRCVAAFQRAHDATEHFEAQRIASQISDHAMLLTERIAQVSQHCEFLQLLAEFIINRTYNLAFKAVQDRYRACGRCDRLEYQKCIDVMQTCLREIHDSYMQLRIRMGICYSN